MCPPTGDLPDPRIEPAFPTAPALQVDFLPLSYQGSPHIYTIMYKLINKDLLYSGFNPCIKKIPWRTA